MDMMQMLQQFNQFRHTFSGNPQQEVLRLVNSGRMSQAELNRLQKQASEILKMLKSSEGQG